MTDRHDSIRESARAALVAIGEPALPTLKQLSEGDDSATATAAKKVIAQIEGGRGRPPAAQRGFGFGGGGFGGGFDRGGFGAPGTPPAPPKPPEKIEEPRQGTPVPGGIGRFGGGFAGGGGGFSFAGPS